MKTRIIAILIVLAFICIAIPNNYSFVEQARADNLAGDFDQFPENETLLDLSNPIHQGSGGYQNNTFYHCGGVGYYGNFFSGTHVGGSLPGVAITFYFPCPYRITRIRIYPMDEDGNFNIPRISILRPDISITIYYTEVTGINEKTDFIEIEFINFVTHGLQIHFGQASNYMNEIEIYYDRTFNPYPMTSQTYYNTTNITNEYNNDTYIDNTYVNDTYLNVTYDNTTYQNDTYTGITYQNVTYLNLTNQTGGEVFYNTTNEFINYTYLNETLVQDNKILEDKLNDLWKELNESKGGEATKDSKSLADKTYSDPILIILLLAILVFQFILFLQRKRNRERDRSIEKEKAIEPEIEHTPIRGITKETDIDIVSRNVQQSQTPQEQYSTQYYQYQHKPAEPQAQQPISSSLAQPQQTEIPTPPPVATVALPSEPPVPTPSTQSNVPYDPNEQKALPEHKMMP